MENASARGKRVAKQGPAFRRVAAWVVAATLLARTAAASPCDPVTSPRRVAVILFNFVRGDEPLSPVEVGELVFTGTDSASAFFAEESSGRLEVVGDVFGWYTVPGDGDCDRLNEWRQAAKANLGAAADQYDTFVYGFVGSCPSQSDASGTAWLAIGPDLRSNIFVHEMSHAFGLMHSGARLWVDEDGRAVPVGGECVVDDALCYPAGNCPFGVTCIERSCCRSMQTGDPADVLGYMWPPRHSNVWQLLRLGVLSAEESPAGNVLTVDCEGDYLVAPSHSLVANHGVVLRIPRTEDPTSDVGDYLYLEFRQPNGVFDGFNPADPLVSGPMIRMAPDACAPGWLSPILLDPTVEGESADRFEDAVLPVGRTFVDPESGIEITTVSVSAEGARVHIKPGPCPSSEDADHDGLCDACVPCHTLVPGQTAWRHPRLDVRLGRDDTLSLKGRFHAADAVADPARDGARVLVRSASGVVLLDLALPGGDSWDRSPDGARQRFAGRLQAGTARMSLHLSGDTVDISFSLKRATLPAGPFALPLQAAVILGGSEAALAGRCGEPRFAVCKVDPSGSRTGCR